MTERDYAADMRYEIDLATGNGPYIEFHRYHGPRLQRKGMGHDMADW